MWCSTEASCQPCYTVWCCYVTFHRAGRQWQPKVRTTDGTQMPPVRTWFSQTRDRTYCDRLEKLLKSIIVQVGRGNFFFRVGTWFYPLIVDWKEEDLNVNFQLIVRKLWGLNWLNDWRSPAYVTREKSDVSPENPVMTFWLNYKPSFTKWKICMDAFRKITTGWIFISCRL